LSKTTPEKAEEYQRSRLNAGDLVYEIRGSIGRVVEVPEILEGANLTQDTARIAPRDEVDADWLKYALRSEPFKQQMELNSRGATVKGVNLYDLRRGLLPVPPYEEQQKIAQLLSAEEEDIDGLIDHLNSSIQKVIEKRNTVIARAVTGQIDLSGWQQPDTQELTL
jgi:type I restriction enzyme S subunit